MTMKSVPLLGIGGTVQARLGSGNSVVDKNGSLIGNIKKDMTGVLRVLSSESRIELQLCCSLDLTSASLRGNAQQEQFRGSINSLSANIYGSMDMFDDVGVFLQSVGVFLQDPQDCDRNVQYRNPHRLSALDEEALMTYEMRRKSEFVAEKILQTPVDVLSDLETTAVLSEADSPDCLATELYTYANDSIHFFNY